MSRRRGSRLFRRAMVTHMAWPLRFFCSFVFVGPAPIPLCGSKWSRWRQVNGDLLERVGPTTHIVDVRTIHCATAVSCYVDGMEWRIGTPHGHSPLMIPHSTRAAQPLSWSDWIGQGCQPVRWRRHSQIYPVLPPVPQFTGVQYSTVPV